MSSKTRDKLIEVARQLFSHKGVAHTTMNDIANASAKGRRTIYTYFKNKKEIYNAVLDGESERMVDSLRAIVAADAPVDERLRRFLLERLARLLPASGAVTQRAWLRFDGRRLDRIQAMVREKEYAMLSALLAEGCEQGVFRPDRCRLALGFMRVGTAINDIQTVTGYLPPDRDDAVKDYIDFVLTDLVVETDTKQL